MSYLETLKDKTPRLVKDMLRPVQSLFINKYYAELSYWKRVHKKEGGRFLNSHYQRTFLAMANESSPEFLRNKVVADFGCGPRGSLAWAIAAKIRIGIDVLADQYAELFTHDVLCHNMIYVKSTETVIPIPSDFVDILFTMNAIDHVDDFSMACSELVRILKPDGVLIASFNLEEPATVYEPQQLTESMIEKHLLRKMTILSYRTGKKGPGSSRYGSIISGEATEYVPGEEGILWVIARKNPNDVS